MSIGLHSLHPGAPNHGRKRVGRGIGSGHGKTSTKGHKGQKARAGGVKGPAFEGGQMPLQRRLPKRGFSNEPFHKEYEPVNVGALDRFAAGTDVTPDLMRTARLAHGRELVKILGGGELTQKLVVHAHAFSQSAKAKIEAAGGQAITL